MPKKISVAKLPDVLSTAPWDKADAFAIQALAHGIANEDQQKRALNWIIHQACDFNGLPWYPGASDRDTSFANGKRFVALQINALLHENLRKTDV